MARKDCWCGKPVVGSSVLCAEHDREVTSAIVSIAEKLTRPKGTKEEK